MKILRTKYHAETNSLECPHCGDETELYRNTGSDPEKLMQVREEYELNHIDAMACKMYQAKVEHELERIEVPFAAFLAAGLRG